MRPQLLEVALVAILTLRDVVFATRKSRRRQRHCVCGFSRMREHKKGKLWRRSRFKTMLNQCKTATEVPIIEESITVTSFLDSPRKYQFQCSFGITSRRHPDELFMVCPGRYKGNFITVLWDYEQCIWVSAAGVFLLRKRTLVLTVNKFESLHIARTIRSGW